MVATAAIDLAAIARRAAILQLGQEIARQRTAVLEDDPHVWLSTLFPANIQDAFAFYHDELWAWIWSIEKGIRPKPFAGIWPRGGAKSTSAEMACARLGATKKRRYVLYVSETQEQADDHVQSIGTLLESDMVARYYPEMANRAIGKYGNVKAWRRNRLRTTNGFTIDAVGLDTAARGIKIDDARPDFLILDDIDGELDSIGITAKKIKTLTTKLLPAGSRDCAILAIQNLVHPDSIFTRLVDGRANFLNDRIVSGPFPALEGFAYEERPNILTGRADFVIVAGSPTWVGMSIETCQMFINDWGIDAFKTECQHDISPPSGGLFDDVNYRYCRPDQVPDLVRTCVWCDPAVTDTDNSDSYGIQADGITKDGTIYRLYSWEERTSPDDAIKRAILKAVELGADRMGFESDQGGDTWKTIFESVWKQMLGDGTIPKGTMKPKFASARAGAGHGPKVHRASQQLVDYKQGKIIHVLGTHGVLEKALARFPLLKPFDLMDASYWSWDDLRHNLKVPLGIPAGISKTSSWKGAA